MAATKSAQTVFSGVTTSQTSSAIDCSGDYAQQLYVDINNSGTATGAASFQPQYSPDGGTTWYSNLPTYTAPLTDAQDWVIDVPVTAMKVRVAFAASSGGGSTSTINAQLGQVTALS